MCECVFQGLCGWCGWPFVQHPQKNPKKTIKKHKKKIKKTPKNTITRHVGGWSVAWVLGNVVSGGKGGTGRRSESSAKNG